MAAAKVTFLLSPNRGVVVSAVAIQAGNGGEPPPTEQRTNALRALCRFELAGIPCVGVVQVEGELAEFPVRPLFFEELDGGTESARFWAGGGSGEAGTGVDLGMCSGRTRELPNRMLGG